MTRGSPDAIPWWRTGLGDEEVESVRDAVLNGHVSQGEITRRFEAELAESLGVSHAVATTSGTVALMLGLWALGIGPGDEVIVPDRTYAATAHAALMLGARIVLVDTLPDLPKIDVSKVEAALTPATRAVMAVHLNGRAADVDKLVSLGDAHGFVVVEDAAQALFSRGPSGYLGCLGHAGAGSFGMAKFLHTGQGGAVLTPDEHTASEARLLRNQGVGGDAYDEDFQRLGLNFKFTDIQAAIGLVQLSKVADRAQRLVDIYSSYERGLRDLSIVKIIPVDVDNGELPTSVEVMCPQREKVMSFLADHGIATRTALPCLHRSRHINPSGASSFPNAALFEKQMMWLPSGPSQKDEDVEHVIDILQSYE